MDVKKKLYKFVGLIVMLAMLLAASPLSQVAAAGSINDREMVIEAGADKLVNIQNADGGFPWILPGTTSSKNLLGITALGILEGYKLEATLSNREALALAYDYVVDNIPDYTWNGTAYTETTSGVNSNSDALFLIGLAQAAASDSDLLDAINAYQDSDVTAAGIADLAKARWDQKISFYGSTQEDPLNGTATSYAERLQTELSAALIPWDLSLAVRDAFALDEYFPEQGYDTQASNIAAVISASDGIYFDSTDADQTDYVLGLAGAVNALSIVGDYSTQVDDLTAKLLNVQQPDGSWKWHDPAEPAEQSVQSTAYAVMALDAQGSEQALIAANKGADWLVKAQNEDGGWFAEGGIDPEYPEVDSEAIVALAILPAPVTIGTLGYYSIQSAIDAAPEGATINVAAGTYDEVGQIVIDKDLSIVGADKVTTIIKPTENTGSSGDARGWFLVQAGVEFNLSNVTLDGSGYDIYQGIRSLGTGTIDNNIITNIEYPSYMGVAVVAMGGNMTFSNNTFSNIGRIGMMAYGNAIDDAIITGNIYSGKGDGDWLDYGIEIGGGAKAQISANTITGIGESETDWSSAAILVTDAYPTNGPAAVTILNNTLTNNYIAIYVGYGESDGVIVEAHGNNFTNSYRGISTTTDLVNLVDASLNWWGSEAGPGESQIRGNVVFTPWCGDEACTTLLPDENGEIELPPEATEGEVQAAINNAPEGSTVIVPAGTYIADGGFVVNSSGVTIYLKEGVTIQNNSPCFVINASNTTITSESVGGAVCVPTDGSNGVDVDSGLTNIVIEGLEIDGSTTGLTEADGIHFAGVVTDLNIANMYIHDMPDAGIFFTAEPANVVQIQGNLFMNNGGNGIEAGAFAVPADYNSWGSDGGPSTGDGVSANVDADIWTHVDVYMESDLTDYPNSVYLGEDITFDVLGNLVNAMGVDVTVEFPTELTYLDYALPGLFEYEEIEVLGNTVHFVGYQISSGALTVSDQILFSMAFEGSTVGKDLLLNLDENSDVFSMFAGTDSISTNIYAASLSDITDAEVNAFPTVNLVPGLGTTYAGIPDEFTVEIDNTNGPDLASVGFDFTLPAGAVLEYYDPIGMAWVPFVNLADMGPLAPDDLLSFEFRVTFADSGDNLVTVDLYDLTPDLDTLLASDTETFTVLGDFNVAGAVAMQGRTVRSGVPLTLTDVSGGYADNDITSTFEISDNFVFANVNAAIYRFTTAQDRYLNVTADLEKLFSIDSDMNLPALELKGGNANTDGTVNLADASIISAAYGTGTIADQGDVNFDDRVNIQDLALVGGNYLLTSEVAYADWPAAEHPEVFGTFDIDDHTGLFTAEMYGAYNLNIAGQGIPTDSAGNPVPPDTTTYTSFTGVVTAGDFDTCDVAGMINAMGMDILYGEITCGGVYEARVYGNMVGNFEGWLSEETPLAPVTDVDIVLEGTTTPITSLTIAEGDTVDLAALLDDVAPDRPVRWAIYVNDEAYASIDPLTGVLTGDAESVTDGETVTVIVTVLDDSNVSHQNNLQVTVTAP